VNDDSFEGEVGGEELAAVQRGLAELGAQPLPAAVAARLDARLAAELDSPLVARRRSRGRLRLGAGLAGTAAVAAALVFAFALNGGGSAPGGHPAAAELKRTAGTTGIAASAAPAAGTLLPAGAKCPSASRTGGGRPRAGCPGARGGHARAV
jgi:hypothetical protein